MTIVQIMKQIFESDEPVLMRNKITGRILSVKPRFVNGALKDALEMRFDCNVLYKGDMDAPQQCSILMDDAQISGAYVQISEYEYNAVIDEQRHKMWQKLGIDESSFHDITGEEI